MPYCHVFCCISLLLLVCWQGILVIVFKRYLSSMLVVPFLPGSCAAWSCLCFLGPAHWQNLVSLWLPLNVCDDGEYFSSCCYNWAPWWEPYCPLHLLSVVKASQALAVAQQSCCQNPEAFLAWTLSGSSRCWDFSKFLRPWEEESGCWHRLQEFSEHQETSPEDVER
jgi:hypothetical protein